MKHFKLILTIIVAAASAFSFTKCAEDESSEAPTKAEILKAKAKELSAKYGIDITLNEENLESVADTLTPEQMEKDFERIAALRGTTIIGTTSAEKPKRRLKIRLNKTMEEEKETYDRDTDFSGNTEMRTTARKEVRGNGWNYMSYRFDVTADVRWQYALNKAHWLYVTLTLVDENNETYEGGCELPNAAFSTDPVFHFSADGSIGVRLGVYSVTFRVSVYYYKSQPVQSSIILS